MKRTIRIACLFVISLAGGAQAQIPQDFFDKVREIRRDLWDDGSAFEPVSDAMVIVWGLGVAAAGIVLDGDGSILTCADVFYDAEYNSMFEIGAVNFRVPYGTPLKHSVARLEEVDFERNLLLLKVDDPPSIETVIALSDLDSLVPGTQLKSATISAIDDTVIEVQAIGPLTASGIACIPLLDQDNKLVGLFNFTNSVTYLKFLFVSDYSLATSVTAVRQLLSNSD